MWSGLRRKELQSRIRIPPGCRAVGLIFLALVTANTPPSHLTYLWLLFRRQVGVPDVHPPILRAADQIPPARGGQRGADKRRAQLRDREVASGGGRGAYRHIVQARYMKHGIALLLLLMYGKSSTEADYCRGPHWSERPQGIHMTEPPAPPPFVPPSPCVPCTCTAGHTPDIGGP